MPEHDYVHLYGREQAEEQFRHCDIRLTFSSYLRPGRSEEEGVGLCAGDPPPLPASTVA